MVTAGDGVEPHRASTKPPAPHRDFDGSCDCGQCQSERFFAWVVTLNADDDVDRNYA